MTVFQSIKKGLIPAKLSVDDVYALTEAGVLAENERMELIDGEVVPMTGGEGNWHAMMEARLTRGIVRALPEHLRLYPAPSITLSPGTLLEPDLAVLPKGSMIRDMRGPDLLLVIEVADSSLAYDCRVKAPLYAAHGVREYWVVDAVRQTIRVHGGSGGAGYRDVEEHDADVAITSRTIPELTITLGDLD